MITSVDEAIIEVQQSLCPISRLPLVESFIRYRVEKFGTITVESESTVREDATWLPRFGFDFILPAGFEKIEFFGRGPDESYQDTRHTQYGLYRNTVDGEYVPYIMPQDHGNHDGVTYACIYDELGRGLEFTAEQCFEFKASHYDAHELTDAIHTNEVIRHDETFVRIDYKDSGIGSASCGPELLEKYRLSEKKIHFCFSLYPVYRL